MKKSAFFSFALGALTSLVSAGTAQAAPSYFTRVVELPGNRVCIYDQNSKLIGLDEQKVHPQFAQIRTYATPCESTPQAQFRSEPGDKRSSKGSISFLENVAHPDFCTPAFPLRRSNGLATHLPDCDEAYDIYVEMVKDGTLGKHTYEVHAASRALQPMKSLQNLHYDILGNQTIYSDSSVPIKITTSLPTLFHREADYRIVVWADGRQVGTRSIEVGDRGITLNLSDFLDQYAREVKFELQSSRKDSRGVARNDRYRSLSTKGGFEYIAHPEGYSEGSAELINPLHPRSYPGAVLITGVVVYDFFTEDIYRCTGAEKSFAQYDIGDNNRLLSCGAAALDIFGVGDLLKLGAKGDDVHDIYKVTRKFRENGNTYVELKPAARTDIANSAYKSNGRIPTPEEVFEPVKRLPYTDDLIEVAGSTHKFRKSWFANYKLTSERLGHIQAGHTHTAVEKKLKHIMLQNRRPGTQSRPYGVFYDETQIVHYIDDVLTNRISDAAVSYNRQHRSYNVEYDFGGPIGYEMNLNDGTLVIVNKIRIALDKNGLVRSAFPIR